MYIPGPTHIRKISVKPDIAVTVFTIIFLESMFQLHYMSPSFYMKLVLAFGWILVLIVIL